MFRDGVGDGQLQYASEYEVPQLQSCFSLVSPTYSPKLTVVIVQKRINCRVFHEMVSHVQAFIFTLIFKDHHNQ